MIVKTRDNETGTEKDVFVATERSAFIVQRCPSCDMIHILLFHDRADKVASACIDITDAFAEQLIGNLVMLLAQKNMATPQRGPSDTLN